MKIVRYVSCNDMTVQFLDDFKFERDTTYSNFKRGLAEIHCVFSIVDECEYK